MSVERKCDGEYCQVHIDLSGSGVRIKIFFKSGRDSTVDRIGLHRVLRDSLKLDTSDCKIRKQCILEGELLVWSENHGRIEPFSQNPQTCEMVRATPWKLLGIRLSTLMSIS